MSDDLIPPTVIVVHPREKRSKCTVEPLRGRPDFVFHKFPRPLELDPTQYVRLGIGGPLLTPADAAHGLLVLDGTWRLITPMEEMFAAIPVRSLPPCLTAYPRSSKIFVDPETGLATIEAIYLAYRQLGRATDGLLDAYRWREEFLDRNQFAERP